MWNETTEKRKSYNGMYTFDENCNVFGTFSPTELYWQH